MRRGCQVDLNFAAHSRRLRCDSRGTNSFTGSENQFATKVLRIGALDGERRRELKIYWEGVHLGGEQMLCIGRSSLGQIRDFGFVAIFLSRPLV
jgi:hypothetical protein